MSSPPPIGSKRRKSSPQMDPILDYNPTPLHILEKRRRCNATYSSSSSSGGINSNETNCFIDYSNVEYNPSPILNSDIDFDFLNPSHSSISKARNAVSSGGDNDEYVPLLRPNPNVVGRLPANRESSSSSEAISPQISSTTPQASSKNSNIPSTNSTTSRRGCVTSFSAPRPVSRALAQAVARRRNSQPEHKSAITLTEVDTKRCVTATSSEPSSGSSAYAEKPVPWSPQMPSKIQPVKEDSDQLKSGDTSEYSKYQPLRVGKQRVAHRPTKPKNNNNRPSVPVGISKKVPMSTRIKMLDVIINEYLTAGHNEDQSYREALKEEKALANRAASNNIYMNLVASLKKKIRESAGV